MLLSTCSADPPVSISYSGQYKELVLWTVFALHGLFCISQNNFCWESDHLIFEDAKHRSLYECFRENKCFFAIIAIVSWFFFVSVSRNFQSFFVCFCLYVSPSSILYDMSWGMSVPLVSQPVLEDSEQSVTYDHPEERNHREEPCAPVPGESVTQTRNRFVRYIRQQLRVMEGAQGRMQKSALVKQNVRSFPPTPSLILP